MDAKKRLFGALIGAIAVLGLSGCASTNPGTTVNAPDPLEGLNRSIYGITDSLDKAVLAPAARGYKNVTSEPVRRSVTNFFDNVGYLNTILNDFLQGKVGDGVSDIGRFVVNSTLGIGGLFDPATSMNLPRNNEDLGQTLAVWGFDSGAYIYAPFGPTTVRNTPDEVASRLLNPFFYLGAPVAIPVGFLNAINSRANNLAFTDTIAETSADPYSFVRSGYLQRRNFLIYDRNPPIEDEFEDIDFGDEESADDGVLKIY